ncbi:MAG: GNAT family N-acetyltransferase [Planctomycetota bacterium]
MTAATEVATVESITVPAGNPRTEPRISQGITPPARASMYVEAFRDWGTLSQHLPAWEDLARDAVEPNVFYEPWMLEPALRHFGEGIDFRFLLIFAPDLGAPLRPPRLVAFFPLQRTRGYRGLPTATLRLWRHIHCFLSTPLIRRGFVADAWGTLFNWLKDTGESLLELSNIHASGPVFTHLLDALWMREQQNWTFESFARALMVRGENGEQYLSQSTSGGYRKELRRLWRRLGERGSLEFRALETPAALDEWVASFLELEKKGWKGVDGGALARDSRGAAFFRAIVAAAGERGQLCLMSLCLDGRPIAMKCNFTSGEGAFAFKIAFDESFARSSPGVQLELENVRWFHAQSKLRWMDSCADPCHPMIGRVWSERRVMSSMLISSGSRRGDLAVAMMPAFRGFKRLFKRSRRRESSLGFPGGE